jgi:hypothetical protein
VDDTANHHRRLDRGDADVETGVSRLPKKKIFGRLTEVVPPPAHRERTALEG